MFKQMCMDNQNIQNIVPLHYNPQPHKLLIKVQPSENFYDPVKSNKYLEYYSTCSKKRGRCLILNNYNFSKRAGGYRNGADVDNINLYTLFKQMGGWDIIMEENKTALVSVFSI